MAHALRKIGPKVSKASSDESISSLHGNSEVSVKLVRLTDSAVVWAYQVRKANAGPLGIQSLSEAIAKHLKE